LIFLKFKNQLITIKKIAHCVEETINAIKPPSVMDVNLSAIRGRTPGIYSSGLGWGLVVKTN